MYRRGRGRWQSRHRRRRPPKRARRLLCDGQSHTHGPSRRAKQPVREPAPRRHPRHACASLRHCRSVALRRAELHKASTTEPPGLAAAQQNRTSYSSETSQAASHAHQWQHPRHQCHHAHAVTTDPQLRRQSLSAHAPPPHPLCLPRTRRCGLGQDCGLHLRASPSMQQQCQHEEPPPER